MKKIFLLLFSFSFLHATNESNNTPPQKIGNTYPLKNGSISLNGEFLWFKPYAFIPFSLTHITTGPRDYFDNQRVQKVNFSFNPGFRLQIGFYMPTPSWKMHWTYTRFRTSDKRDVYPDTNEVLSPIWESIQLFIPTNVGSHTSAHAKQMLNYNVFDWDLQSSLFSGMHFALTPTFGVRTAYIRNDLTVRYDGENISPELPVEDKVNVKNHFRAIGLKGGLNLSYLLGQNFELFGISAVSILLSRITRHHHEKYIAVNTTGELFSGRVGNSNRYLSTKSSFDLALGISWGLYFGEAQKRYFSLSTAYEVHIWPDQIQLMRIQSSNNLGDLSNPIDFYKADLCFQGLKFKGSLEF